MTTPAAVLYFQRPALYRMYNQKQKQPDFDDTDDNCGAHKVSGLVEHLAIVFGIKERKIVKNTGVNANVYHQKWNKKQTR